MSILSHFCHVFSLRSVAAFIHCQGTSYISIAAYNDYHRFSGTLSALFASLLHLYFNETSTNLHFIIYVMGSPSLLVRQLHSPRGIAQSLLVAEPLVVDMDIML